jgi:hypothetical protein
VSVPSAIIVDGDAGPDRVHLEIIVREALASVAPQASPEEPSPTGGRQTPRVAFLQLRGEAHVRGTIDGRPVAFSGDAAAETFVPIEH